ncbi:MAG: DUF2200 domain-containing protein [Tenericutes bacterium HGW-Tenericutes-5]|jgi:hypothetical protein|nr:MAG: DUF2200 domain-containing protein [Tenericutes bacterium HGW-Tenericutes-5]
MEHKIFAMPFSKIYKLYIQKVEKKDRTKDEVDEIIIWLTSYEKENLESIIKNNLTVKEFFENAPSINEKTSLIKGVICGVRVEEIEDKLMRNIRYMDKLIDELAKGRSMVKILRK